jgi:hypothetical protein
VGFAPPIHDDVVFTLGANAADEDDEAFMSMSSSSQPISLPRPRLTLVLDPHATPPREYMGSPRHFSVGAVPVAGLLASDGQYMRPSPPLRSPPQRPSGE